MKVSVSQTSTLSSEKVFSVLKQSLKEDYFLNTEKKLEDSAINEGLTYIKKYGKNKQHTVKVVISSYIENQLYEAVFSSNRGRQLISYEISSLSNDEIVLTLKQETVSMSFFQNLNDRLMSLFFKKRLERQLLAQLAALIRVSSKQQ